MKNHPRAVALLALLAWAVPARAAEPQSSRTQPRPDLVIEERPTTRNFYGWEILLTGETGGVLVAASVFLPEKPVSDLLSTTGFILGMPAFGLGGPIIHWTHGSFSKGLVSLGGNLTLSLASAFAGSSIACSKSDDADCSSRGLFRGIGVAAVVAPLLDAAILGWEDVPVDDYTRSIAARRPRENGSLRWAPVWSVGPRGSIELGVAGKL
jgi:hypothetical protein